ncbi:hypothetical protein CLU79DRAFT_736471 [Phycomyces nitens]|nr:hypothetical protein CLU79DRAFT_736471 [Phycomyces nitens]
MKETTIVVPEPGMQFADSIVINGSEQMTSVAESVVVATAVLETIVKETHEAIKTVDTIDTTRDNTTTGQEILSPKSPLSDGLIGDLHKAPIDTTTTTDTIKNVNSPSKDTASLPSPPSSLGSQSPKSTILTARPPRVLRKRKSDQVARESVKKETADGPSKKKHRKILPPIPEPEILELPENPTTEDTSLTAETVPKVQLQSPPKVVDLVVEGVVPDIWCRHCGITETCRWRYGPLGKQTLCNACHLRWKSRGKCNEGYDNVHYPPPIIENRTRQPRKPNLKRVHATISKRKDKAKDVGIKPKAKKPQATTSSLSSAGEHANSEPSSKRTLETANNPDSAAPVPNGCKDCGRIITGLWRRGPSGPRSLCNACGQRWSKNVRGRIKDNYANDIPIETSGAIEPGAPVRHVLLHKRKKFLKAALYSLQYKIPSLATKPPKTLVKTPTKAGSKKQDEAPFQCTSEKTFKFPMPIHHGALLIDSYAEFQLPPDIMEEYKLGLIGKFGVRPTSLKKPIFTRLRSNIFVGRKPNRTEHQAPCQCVPPPDGSKGCGEDCLNRMLFYECDPKSCPCKSQCSNQRFQRKEGTKELQIFLTRERGWGLRTLVDVNRGDLLVEYRGEVISHKMCEERMRTVYTDQKNFYFLDYQNGEVVDACSKGTEARFINHSCDPNCHIEKWALKGELAVGVFASRHIPANSELFYDYNFSVFGNAESQQICHCGSEKCRGSIGKKPSVRSNRPVGN